MTANVQLQDSMCKIINAIFILVPFSILLGIIYYTFQCCLSSIKKCGNKIPIIKNEQYV
jgi:hypothetical protein